MKMYDEALYKYDKNNKKSSTAKLQNGAILYRLTSISHCDRDSVLNGLGPEQSLQPGRFNSPQQRTTYCANNVLVCISEILYHNYRTTLKRVHEKQPPEAIRANIKDKRCLVFVCVNEIKCLVYIDSRDFQVQYDPRIRGTMVIHPDQIYEPFQKLSDQLRMRGEKGIFYPSARHSKDICIALFRDETPQIQESLETLNVDLILVQESQDPTLHHNICDPIEDKLHSTMGFYSFPEIDKFEQLRSLGTLYPQDIKPAGLVDFVRRRYLNYPHDATL